MFIKIILRYLGEMIRATLFFFLLFFSASRVVGQPELASFFDDVNQFFGMHITNGKLDTSNLADNEQLLHQLLFQIDSLNLENYSKETQEAILLNAYTMFVLKDITHGQFPKTQGDFRYYLNSNRHFINGTRMSLNQLRNDLLLGTFGDQRILFATGCATRGDGPLFERAFYPDSLDEQLEIITLTHLNDPYYLRVKPKSHYVLLPELMEDFLHYFGGDVMGVIRFINLHRTTSQRIPTNYTIAFYPHSWKLNCIPEKPGFY